MHSSASADERSFCIFEVMLHVYSTLPYGKAEPKECPRLIRNSILSQSFRQSRIDIVVVADIVKRLTMEEMRKCCLLESSDRRPL